jgi:3-isopropylmalate/(R)-2-methylmalate dehydratase large subunit
MVEKGHVLPGNLIVGADSHTTTYGALNAAATGIGASEMAYVIKTGKLWFRVPETIKFVITGRLPEYVSSKDVILYIAGKYSVEVAQYKAIEWTGSAVDDMSIDARLTMGNMSVELGAKLGIFRADRKTVEYGRPTDKPFEPVDPDPDAVGAETTP